MSLQHLLWQLPLILACLVPAALTLSAIFVTRSAPFRAPTVVTSVTVGISALAVILHAVFTALDHEATAGRLRQIVQLDLVSAAMLVLVCTLAVVVVRYSSVYLAAEQGLQRYARSLVLALAAVTLLVISNQLGLLIGCWIATALFLHQLLTFFPKRRQAVIVAHKRFLLAMLANLSFCAFLLFVQADVGTLQLDTINAIAASNRFLPPALQIAMILLVFGVLLKTAQLPFHGWLLQVMEAPTPVSALLHAGVVNIGGYVMIRLSPLMARAPLAQWILLGVGLLTAILASLVMATRASVKMSLAWSTIAQMGFMLVQCGLGVWHLALLHLLAHSFYKAHMFLTAGSVVETWRGTSLVKSKPPSLLWVAAGTVVVGIASVPLWAAFKYGPLHASTSVVTFAVALGLGFVPMIAKALKGGLRSFGIALGFMLGASISYFVLHAIFEGVAPTIGEPSTSLKWSVVLGGLIVLFLAQTVLQTNPRGRLGRFLQPHLRSGLYIDDWFTRLTFRLWPPRLERPSSSSRRSSVTLEAR